MKKKLCLLVLSVSSLAIIPSLLVPITPSVVDGDPIVKKEASVSHTITNSLPNQITLLDAPTSAVSGEVVELKVEFDADKVELRSLLVNGNKAAKVDDKNYYFIMPDADVTITCDATIKGEFTITNASEDDGIILQGLAEGKLNAGDQVKFSVLTKEGSANNFTGDLSIYYVDVNSTKQEVNFTVDENIYTFTMPAANVVIEAEVEARLFRVKELVADLPNDPTGWDFINYIYETKVGEDTRTSINTKQAAYAGSTITVEFADNNISYVATGVTIVETGEHIPLTAGSDELTFVMPTHDVSLKPTFAENYVPFTLTDSEHFTLEAYTKNEEGEYELLDEHTAIPGTMVYFKVEGNDPDYKVDYLAGSYTSTWGSSSSISKNAFELQDDGYYAFEMLNEDDIEISPVEIAAQTLTLNNSEHLTLSAFTKNEDGSYSPVTKFFAGDTLYFKVDGANEDYTIHSVRVAYVTEAGTKYEYTAELQDDGYYMYKTGENTKNYNITVVELSANLLEGYPFLGTYKITNVYGSSSVKLDGTPSNTIEISQDGSINLDDDEQVVTSVDGEKEDTTGVINITEENVVAYGPNVVFTSYHFDKLTNNDNYFGVKIRNPEATYTTSSVSLDLSGIKHQVFQAYETIDGVTSTVCTAYYEYNNSAQTGTYALENVELKNASGEVTRFPSVNDDELVGDNFLDVYVDGVKKGTIQITLKASSSSWGSPTVSATWKDVTA